ncbi:MAG: hypothetical protein ACO1QB_04555 [Verrucomicrobiales bacterium]
MEPLEKLKVNSPNKNKPQVSSGPDCAKVKSKDLNSPETPGDRGNCEKKAENQGGEFK